MIHVNGQEIMTTVSNIPKRGKVLIVSAAFVRTGDYLVHGEEYFSLVQDGVRFDLITSIERRDNQIVFVLATHEDISGFTPEKAVKIVRFCK